MMIFEIFGAPLLKLWKVLAVLCLIVLGLIKGGCGQKQGSQDQTQEAPWRIHTLFSVECQNYFDWQTVGLMHSYRKANQPGPITRLLSCTPEERKTYRGIDLAPTFEVPSMSTHPKTGDWYFSASYLHLRLILVCNSRFALGG